MPTASLPPVLREAPPSSSSMTQRAQPKGQIDQVGFNRPLAVLV